MSLVALIDASVLYRATARSILLYIALSDVFRPRWSQTIQHEWVRALVRNEPNLDPVRLARTQQLMETHFPDASVTGFETRVAELDLPDPDDRHVLAAAIAAGASVIVTENLKDFPEDALAPFGITAMTADAFVSGLLEADPEAVVAAIAADRAGLRNPPLDVPTYLAALAESGLEATAAALSAFADRL